MKHLSWEECLKRWPRICKLLQWSMIASEGEAACCLRDYRMGYRYGSEVVSHSGLSPADRVKDAVAWRRTIRNIYPQLRITPLGKEV